MNPLLAKYFSPAKALGPPAKLTCYSLSTLFKSSARAAHGIFIASFIVPIGKLKEHYIL